MLFKEEMQHLQFCFSKSVSNFAFRITIVFMSFQEFLYHLQYHLLKGWHALGYCFYCCWQLGRMHAHDFDQIGKHPNHILLISINHFVLILEVLQLLIKHDFLDLSSFLLHNRVGINMITRIFEQLLMPFSITSSTIF